MDAPEPLTEDYINRIDWNTLQVPGDTAVVPAQGDLPPGRVEVVPAEEYAKNLARVEAREAGVAGRARLAGWGIARGTGTLLGWTATGTAGVTALGWDYLRAHDEWEREGGHLDKKGRRRISPEGRRKVVRLRRHRWRFVSYCGLGGVAANLGGWWGLVAFADMAAADSWYLLPGVESTAVAAALTLYGRYRQRHQVDRYELVAPEHLPALEPGPDDDDGEPYPIAQAGSPHEAADCLHRALAAEGVPVADVTAARREEWGWSMVVRVSEGTPAAITAAAGGLETRLDLPAGGVKTQPQLARRACAVVRLVSGDPFATAPPLPHRAPGSLSITDRARVGTSIAGEPLEITLAGVIGLVVAASGGGKTGLLQALAEVTTACRDAITIDLDPHGDGLEDLAPAVRLTGRSQEQIEAVLLWLLMYSKGRARLRKQLGMGRKWAVTPDRPAFVVFVDEFPKLSDLGKRLAFDLALVGRKEGVWMMLASQGGTKLYLGEAIAQMLALKIVGPCKVGDTRAVFGEGSTQEGWAPHTLSPATDTDPRDAGHIYAQGIPGAPDEPVEYKVHEIPSTLLAKLAKERSEYLLDPDRDSLDAMHKVDLPDYVQPVFDAEGGLKKEAPVDLLTWDALLRLCDQDDSDHDAPARATGHIREDAAAVMREQGIDRMKTERLTEALREWSEQLYGDLTADLLRERMRDARAGSPVTLGPLDGEANPRGYKLARLTE